MTQPETDHVLTPMAIPYDSFMRLLLLDPARIEETLQQLKESAYCERHGIMSGGARDGLRKGRSVLFARRHLLEQISVLTNAACRLSMRDPECLQELLYEDILPDEGTLERVFFEAWEAINIPLLLHLREFFVDSIDSAMSFVPSVVSLIPKLGKSNEDLARERDGLGKQLEYTQGSSTSSRYMVADLLMTAALERLLGHPNVSPAFAECGRRLIAMSREGDGDRSPHRLFPHKPPLDWRPPLRGTPERNFWNAAKRLEIRILEYGG